jgi:hypothetical protein
MDRVQNVATPAVDTTGARRSLAAIWRTFVKASAFEAEEGRVIAMAWCCPWLYVPVMRLGIGDQNSRIDGLHATESMTTEGSSDRLSSRPEQSPQGGITERRNEPRPSTCADLRVIPEVKSSDRCFDRRVRRALSTGEET